MNLEERYNKNMSYLKQYWPVVYKNLLLADISNYELSIEKNDEINISVNGRKIYPNNVNEAIEKQVDTFIKAPTSYFRRPSWYSDSGYDFYHDKFIIDIERSSPYIAEKNPFSGYSHNLEGFIPILLVFGIGSGNHIQQLLDKTKEIGDLIIIDENYEFLKISMHLMDWEPIFEYFQKNHHTLHFIIKNNAQNNCYSLLNTIFGNFPYYFFNVYFITHYESNFFKSIKEILLKKINLGIAGIGFYDDEVNGLKHTIENLIEDRPIFRYTDKLPHDSVAFIIGSGPSIDNDIEMIKKLQDKAVVFSCGTSLKILYNNGIVPDYHFEQERDENQKERIITHFPKEYIKKINLIGLNVVSPKIYELFKSSKTFFRINDAGGSIAPDDIPHLDHCNPTVVNATLSFASAIGFDNIFLFGADMGYKDPKNHHSKSSDYYNEDTDNIEFVWLKDTKESKFPGNFDKDEKFYTVEGYLWCKQRVENCIHEYNITKKKSINYFNCSDGLAIDHCAPLHSNKLQICKDLIKEEVIQGVENSFDKNFDSIHKMLEVNYSTQLKIFNDDIISIEKLIQASKIESFGQFFILMKRCFAIINYINEPDKSVISRSMLKGTTFHFIASVYTHALAGSNLEASLKYINKCLEKYLDFLDMAKKEINSFKSELLQ